MIGAAQVMCILGVSNAQAWTLMFNDVVPDAPKLVPPNVEKEIMSKYKGNSGDDDE